MTSLFAEEVVGAGIDVFTGPTLVDRYLAEQKSMTAVEQFARRHESGLLPRDNRYYADLMPLDQPVEGEQYGFEVDLDACTGCKACVTACHSLNGLDEDESWRSVGLLHGGTTAEPLQQTVTTACHHCVDPACLSGCPVDAYEKDPVTGIVSHLDDQCIGCGYCTLTCPYEVPRFNASKGIVRKCDLCRDRLAEGEAPACVQSCPNGAIRIVLVDKAAAVRSAAASTLVPGAPPSSITVPTTVYRTSKAQDGLRAADHFSLRPAHAHPPLAVMLVLTQLAVGAFVTDLVVRWLAPAEVLGAFGRYNAVVALTLGLLALGASVFHLGRPLYAFRAVIGFRHSWLSREIVAFAAFALLAAGYSVLAWGSPPPGTRATRLLGMAVAAVGVLGMLCSVMVYVATRRTWWRASFTGVKFASTSAVCGLAAVMFTSTAASLLLDADAAHETIAFLARPLGLSLAGASLLKLTWEALFLRRHRGAESSDLGRTALLLKRDLRTSTRLRFFAGALGGVVLPVGLVEAAELSPPPLLFVAAAGVVLAVVVAGELLERSQFFRAVTAPRMPGGFS